MKKIDEFLNDKRLMQLALLQRRIIATNGEESIDKNNLVPWGFEGYEYPDPKNLDTTDEKLVNDYLDYIEKYYGYDKSNWGNASYGHIQTDGLIQKNEEPLYNYDDDEFDYYDEFVYILGKIEMLLRDKHDIEQYAGDTDYDDDYCNYN